MGRAAAILLAHLNPLTKAHQSIISFLQKDYNVYIFPVRFLKLNEEVNTKSFPFPYKLRKAMVESIFGSNDNVTVSADYTFVSPYIKYFPPLISPYSWMLRNQLVRNIKEMKFISYTGDMTERIVLTAYRLHPIRAKRLEIAASAVKEMLYSQVIDKNTKHIEVTEAGPGSTKQSWQDNVPEKVVNLIIDNWRIIEKFGKSPDHTIKIMGMKFPKEGFYYR